MLITQKIKRYISLLLVLSLIFLVMTNTFANFKCLDSYTPKSPITFSTSAVHTDIAFLNSDSRKTTFHSISAEIYDYFIGYVCFADVSENESIYHATPPDYRREIERAIPHYFHGSKYKDGNLFI